MLFSEIQSAIEDQRKLRKPRMAISYACATFTQTGSPWAYYDISNSPDSNQAYLGFAQVLCGYLVPGDRTQTLTIPDLVDSGGQPKGTINLHTALLMQRLAQGNTADAAMDDANNAYPCRSYTPNTLNIPLVDMELYGDSNAKAFGLYRGAYESPMMNNNYYRTVLSVP